MSVLNGQGVVVRFSEFELDLRSGELRVNGGSAKLQPQPAKILALLVRRCGETVTRDEIVREVWGSDTFVDYDGGLNFAIRQIRQTLGDNADRPLYIETVPKRGYRFVGQVDGHALDSVQEFSVPSSEESENSPRSLRDWRRHVFKAAAVVLAVLGLLGVPRIRHWVVGTATAKPVQSLAVLPFENLSGDSSKDYFADGFTDELITDLAEQTKIRVVSRSSVMRYKGSRKSLPEMARELGVDGIVEGSVSLSDLRVRITAQLIEAATDRHLWAHSYEKNRNDLFSIQSELAATIASLVGSHTGSQTPTTGTVGRRFTPETYQLNIECRNLIQTGSTEGIKQAVQCYQQMVNLDPNCASAYAGLANSYVSLGQLANLPKARAAATKALELDSSLSEAHDALAWIKLGYETDLTGADAEISRALALNPSDDAANMTCAMLLIARGRAADAIAAAKTARELNPFSARIATQSGMIMFFLGQYDRTIEEEQAALKLDPHHQRSFYWLGYAYEQKGMYRDAIAEYEKVLPNDNRGSFLAALGRSLALAGDSKRAAQVKRKIEHFPKGDFVRPYDAALLYAVLGEKDRALQLLERDQKEGGGWFPIWNADPRLAPLRSDPRFQGLVKRVGLPIAASN